MVWFWLAALVVLIVAEAVTVGLVSIWFAIGAFAAMLTALLGAQLWLQILVFVAVSIAMLALTRPLAKKYVDGMKKPTNADRVLEMIAVVVEDVDNVKGTGLVKVDGKTWTARSYTGEVLKTGCLTRAVTIEGVKLIVAPIEQNENN